MSSSRPWTRAELRVKNVGGIDETTVSLDPGTTVLVGRNASNRTSLLQAIAASLGSNHGTVKGDADVAEVTLELGDEAYTRQWRHNDGADSNGEDVLLDDPEVADLFAFLFSWNEARRDAIAGENLRDLILRPVDTDKVDAEIDRLESEKDRIDDELAEIDTLSSEVPELQRRKSRLESEIQATRGELEAARERLAESAADPQQRKEEKRELNERLDELGERRSDLEAVEFDIRSERDSLESLRDELSSLEQRHSDLPEIGSDRVEEIERQLQAVRERKRAIERSINQLDQIVEFNEAVLDGKADDVFSEGEESSVPEKLLDDETVTCWTCGSEVRRSGIESTLDRLRSIRQEHVERLTDAESEIDELTAERERLSSAREDRTRIENRIDRIESEIDSREDRLEEYRRRREELQDTIESLESAVDELRTDDDSVLQHQREVSELEVELDSLESDLEDVEAEIERIQDRVSDREELRRQRNAVEKDLVDARNRIERIENEAIESFNLHMENLLDALAYENVERVWIERTERERRDGRGSVAHPEFELHVVRSSDEGAVYEDVVDHLSESERELIGLVFALSGYLAHEVYEDAPFLLLDSLEAIDSDRIASLVEYFGQHAEYLVVALLPEDAQAVDPDDRITSI